MDVANCSKCSRLYIKNPVRDICDKCYKEEEMGYDKVSTYLKKRENRTATMLQVVQDTGVSEDLIHKFIKQGRIKLVQFPNLTYPCETCGNPIQTGKLCEQCLTELRKDLEIFEREEQRQKELEERKVYFVVDEKFRKHQ